ncbi:ribonuclease P 40kDa subunit-domain-containing protein [Roridomyces roridus]|uniref:Ribonuclease P 40kDa subunit-domain-containing protein n=1 Tax=Roridomyces roridus TaxID=1738132 RepID=A0AAD7AXM3_9AGAR|nr:ribonuclease P 40kDa subunit-domain-containing protein [Roridomyces roridus]
MSSRVRTSVGEDYLEHLAAAHPFTQQEPNHQLQAILCALETTYVKATIQLSDLVAKAGSFVQPLELKSTLIALSVDPHSDDGWCLDPRGLLTLHLSPESHQTLGLTGKKMPFKAHKEKHTVSIPLQPNAESATNRGKRDTALAAWDRRRVEAGVGPWSVIYSANDEGRVAGENQHAELVQRVKCEVRASQSVRIPVVSLSTRPSDLEAAEDWDTDMGALFEWAGLAGLGSQRLNSFDRPDAYVAVYEPPEPSVLGDVTHLRWRGLLCPDFVQSVINAVVSGSGVSQFASITSHAFPMTPVSYIPIGKDGTPSASSPARVPSPDAEDSWCVILVREGGKTKWCKAESIGPLDARWG